VFSFVLLFNGRWPLFAQNGAGRLSIVFNFSIIKEGWALVRFQNRFARLSDEQNQTGRRLGMMVKILTASAF